MHISCETRIHWVFDKYSNYIEQLRKNRGGGKVRILDVGGTDWNGTFSFIQEDVDILDVEGRKGVTICPEDIYDWQEIADDTYDIVMSANTFTYIDRFWLTIKEMQRVVKPGGLVIIITASEFREHGYPRSNWGFNRDGLLSMAEWADLTVVDASVAGVPSLKAGYEWDSRCDDALLIAVKGEPVAKLPEEKLSIERRWKVDRAKLPFKYWLLRKLESLLHHYSGYRG